MKFTLTETLFQFSSAFPMGFLWVTFEVRLSFVEVLLEFGSSLARVSHESCKSLAWTSHESRMSLMVWSPRYGLYTRKCRLYLRAPRAPPLCAREGGRSPLWWSAFASFWSLNHTKDRKCFFLIFNLKFSKKTALAFKKCRPDTRLLPVCAKRRTHCSTTERDFKIKLRIIQIGSLVWAALRATNPHFREAMREAIRERVRKARVA